MKRVFLLSAIFAAMSFATVSCDKESSMTEEGSITVNIINPATKAETAGTEDSDYEKSLNSVTLFVYEKGESGVPQDLYKKVKMTEPFSQAQISGLKKGSYIVYGVANLTDEKASANQTLTAIKGVKVDINDNSVNKNKGFAMTGESAEITVDGNGATADIVLQRFLGRVSLKSITNNLESKREITPLYVMLINGSADDNLGKSAEQTAVVNSRGRNADQSFISTLAEATGNNDDSRKLTFQEYSNIKIASGNTYDVARKTYCYRTKPATEADDQVKLVLAAQIDGDQNVYYYPVAITAVADGYCIKANTTYDVKLTIVGKGSLDPNTPVEKGNMVANVSVKAWDGGAVYNPTI